MYECLRFRDKSLFGVVGNLHGRVLIKRVKKRTEGGIGEEQGGIRRGRTYVNQIFCREAGV